MPNRTPRFKVGDHALRIDRDLDSRPVAAVRMDTIYGEQIQLDIMGLVTTWLQAELYERVGESQPEPEPRYTLVVPIEKRPGHWRRKIINEDELHSFIEAFVSGNTHSDRFYVERMRADEPADSVMAGAPL